MVCHIFFADVLYYGENGPVPIALLAWLGNSAERNKTSNVLADLNYNSASCLATLLINIYFCRNARIGSAWLTRSDNQILKTWLC